MTLIDQFATELNRCAKFPMIFIGIANFFKVQLLTDKKDKDGNWIPRSFEDIYSDMLSAFENMPRNKKRHFLKKQLIPGLNELEREDRDNANIAEITKK